MASADETVKIEPKSGGNSKASLIPVGDVIQIDEPTMDPQEYARLVELYDSSFRNIADCEFQAVRVRSLSFPRKKSCFM